MIRTHILPCALPRPVADALNLASGTIYTSVLVSHWRVVRRQGHWLSEKAATRWSDSRLAVKSLHAHSIDAAQQGFYNACRTTRALRKAGMPDATFPHWRKRFRATIWKNTAIKKAGAVLTLSNGKGNRPITLTLPAHLEGLLRVLEVRLVYDKKSPALHLACGGRKWQTAQDCPRRQCRQWRSGGSPSRCGRRHRTSHNHHLSRTTA
jgi:hypothetical protein